MFHVYLVKIDGNPVGIVANSADGYRFYAIGQFFRDLESLVFGSVENARRAALILARQA